MAPTNEGRLAALVRSCLQARNMTQADLARLMGISESSLSTLINRPKKQLPISTIVKLAKGLGVHTSEVVAAYMEDAGEPADQYTLPGPEAAIIIGAMQHMSERNLQRLARIAQDFTDDEK